MAQIKVVSNFEGNILEWDNVVWGDNGQLFCFPVDTYGTDIADQALVEVGNMDAAALKVLIDARIGVVRQNNPDWDDVKTDTDGDGLANSDNYGWSQEGQLYTCTVI